jgi:hypothetical protein
LGTKKQKGFLDFTFCHLGSYTSLVARYLYFSLLEPQTSLFVDGGYVCLF